MNSTNYFDISPQFPYKKLFVVTNVVGIIVESLTIVHVLIIMKLFMRITVVHMHMKIISYNLWVCLILRSIFNATFHIFNAFYWYPLDVETTKQWFDALRDVFNMGLIIFPVNNLCERIFATIFVHMYEKWFSLKFVTAMCIIPWSMCIYLTVHLYFLWDVFEITILYAGYESFFIFSFIVYIILYLRERKMENKHKPMLSLSERYQRVENQKCCQTIFRFALSSIAIVIHTIVFILGLWYVYPYYYLNVSLQDKIAFSRLFLTLGESIVALALPMHFAHINETLLSNYNSIVRSCFKRQTKVQPESPNQIKSLSGHNLVMPDETAYYFTALQDQWNSVESAT
uniref:Serpentine Receptor, class J n=1 Tax=Panagrellus redivivus TaxID=6233 RepID=A0A7E4V778_PANRE